MERRDAQKFLQVSKTELIGRVRYIFNELIRVGYVLIVLELFLPIFGI
jgi:hypothetical protein